MKKLFLCLLLLIPVTANAQGFNLDDFVPQTVVSEVFENPAISPVPDSVPNQDFDAETKARVEEMRQIAEEIRKIAEDLKNVPLKTMQFDEDQALFNKNVEDRLAKLEADSANHVTRDEVTEIVKEEIKKVMVEMKVDGKVIKKEVELTQSVTVPGYVGTFEVPVGGVITHINGQPVSQVGKTNYGRSSGFILESNKIQKGYRVRLFNSNSQNCRIVNGVKVCN